MSFSFIKKSLLTGAIFILCHAVAFANGTTIREFLERAETTSPVLATARANVASSRADFTGQRAWPNPNLFYERESLSEPDDVTETVIGVEQNIGFLWTKSAKSSAASYAYSAAQAEYEEIARTWSVETAKNLFELDALRRRIAMLDTVVVTAEKLAETMKARRAEGDVSAYEEQRVQFELLELRSQQRQVTKEFHELQRKVIAESGLTEDVVRTVTIEQSLTKPFSSEAEAVEYANEHRALIKQQTAAVASAKKNQSAAMFGMMPDLNLGVGQKTISDGSDGLVFSAGVEIPLFGQRRSERQRATANSNRAEIERAAILQSVESEVRQSYRYCEQFKTIHISDVNSWEADVRDNMMRGIQLYLEGEGSALEVIDALRTSVEAQQAALNLRNSAQLADLELRRVTGFNLWDN